MLDALALGAVLLLRSYRSAERFGFGSQNSGARNIAEDGNEAE
jgi:hypothetical protein